ncbi:MAG: collagenase [Burkholderiales bacterium]|nr:collagenase [Burkholderiales bacterium]
MQLLRGSTFALLAVLGAGIVHAEGIPSTHGPMQVHSHMAKTKSQAPAPHARLKLPPSLQEQIYHLPPTHKPRLDLLPPSLRNQITAHMSAKDLTPACQNIDTMASYSGSALADYVANLPDYECSYGLFSATAAQASTIYSAANLNAVASRFVQEAASYDASNVKLVNLALYFRAGYYLASGGTMSDVPANVLATLRPSIKQLVDGPTLFSPNTSGPTTAGEVLTLITNQHDEAYYLGSMKNVVGRFTNTAANPNAAQALTDQTVSGGFTSLLNIFFNAHSRPDALPLLQSDPSYATALYNFVKADKPTLINTGSAYQLSQTATEAFRFMQYPALLPNIKPMVQDTLANSTMTGSDNDLWLAAAEAVEFYDNANCSQYGTCNFETPLAAYVLSKTYTCPDASIHLRTEELTPDQAQQACALLANESPYFQSMVQANNVPVANDYDTTLEVVVFSNNAEYDKYSPIFFGNDTNNGGIYLEGDPSSPTNQSRFIAFEADWLRPTFSVWNLGHEYVHYMDGRFDMYGDFTLENQVPVVWWLEGLAEYISLKNVDQTAIDAAKTGKYKLSTLFQNTYGMSDYLNRAYYWGYMSVRFMFERHPEVLSTILPKFRVGDYTGYWAYMQQVGTKYDAEFAAWVQTATTAGTPPIPGGGPTLPTCASPSQLGKGCSIVNLSASDRTYAYINLPTGATNLKLWTSGGTGDVDMYVARDRYPTTTSYDFASANPGNNESVAIASPVANHWYYIVLNARQPFTGVSISATYDLPK